MTKTLTVTLADGSLKDLPPPFTGQVLADQISKSLGKSALLVVQDDVLKDLSQPLSAGSKVQILTQKDSQALEVLRHSTAHLMAQAVKDIWPLTMVAIGPVIRDGFYYDFARDKPFTLDDLAIIEKRMRAIIKRNDTIMREEVSRSQARDFFKGQNEDYKIAVLDSIDTDQTITLYHQGQFTDLCRGPHLPSTGALSKAFKLTKVAGAYWRGDSNQPMLQRIYGTAWFSKSQLDDHLYRLAEAKRRDHRKLGQIMDLFHFQEQAPGAIFWHPKGWTLFSTLVQHLRQRQEKAGYQEINTPEVIDRSLWEESGHWDAFRQHMYTTKTEDNRIFAVKPMNCPGGVQVFRKRSASYRDLPMRLAEFGKVHRYEPSGALHGMMRVRAFTQDDAHIYCTPEQMGQECAKVIEFILQTYRDFGFDNVMIKFADRPEKRIGSDDVWDQLEQALLTSLAELKLNYSHNPGEGAFYGPKLEFVLRDALGRDWQCGTLQVDMSMPARLDAHYIGADGSRHHPILLHRAAFGSLERFIGILLEHYGGNLPLWLAPVQVMVLTITDAVSSYAKTVLASLRDAGLRAQLDCRNEKIAYKIRQHSVEKIPVQVILGQKEMDLGQVVLRYHGQTDQEVLALEPAMAKLVGRATVPA